MFCPVSVKSNCSPRLVIWTEKHEHQTLFAYVNHCLLAMFFLTDDDGDDDDDDEVNSRFCDKGYSGSSPNDALPVLRKMMQSLTFHNKHKSIFPLDSTLKRLQFKYCLQFWTPHFKKDVEQLGRVQRGTTKISVV